MTDIISIPGRRKQLLSWALQPLSTCLRTLYLGDRYHFGGCYHLAVPPTKIDKGGYILLDADNYRRAEYGNTHTPEIQNTRLHHTQ